MHQAAHEWVRKHSTAAPVRVLDIGGRNINGSCRVLFPGATEYVAVDLHAGDEVDVVSEITTWDDPRTFDVVLCCEVLEHAENWRDILRSAYDRCKDGGQFVMTCAGPGRKPHSGFDGSERLRPEEHYGNVFPEALEAELGRSDWSMFLVDQKGADVRAVAIR